MAIRKYDPQRGASLATYAYNAIEQDYRNAMRKTRTQCRSLYKTISMDAALTDDPSLSLDDCIGIPDDDSQIIADDFMDALTEEEKDILSRRTEGFSQREIGDAYGAKQPWASRRMKKIRNKYYDFYEQEAL